MSAIAKALMTAAGQASGFVSTVFASNPSGLFAIDVRDAASPALLGSVTADLNSNVLVYSKKHNYVFASSGVDLELFAIDVSDPSSMSVNQILSLGAEPHDMVLDDENDILYTIDKDSKLRVYDTSTPNSVTYLRYISVLANGDSATMALDVARKRLLINAASATISYTLHLVDVSSPAFPSEIDTLATSTSETNSGYAALALNVVSGRAIQLTYARSRIIDYSSDTLSDVSSQYTARSTTYSARRPAYYRARDKVLFSKGTSIYDLSSGVWNGSSAINTLPTDIKAHDDYRMVTFGLNTSTGNLECYDTSDPTVDVLLGSYDFGGSGYLGGLVTNTSSASATKAYGR